MEPENNNPPGLPIMPTANVPQRPQRRNGSLRRFLGRGLAVLLPTLLTLIILLWAYGILDTYVAEPINEGIRMAVVGQFDMDQLQHYGSDLRPGSSNPPTKMDLMRAFWDTHYLGWVGMVVALLAVFGVGLLVSSFLGRAAWRVIERMILRVPLIKQIYPYVKQVTDFVFNERPLEFSRVVMVEYPRRGCWSLGLVTGHGIASLHTATGKELVAVFIPSSPTPVTGYVIQVPRDEVIDVPLSVDEALRFTITGGVVVPEGETVPHALPAGRPAGGEQ